MNKILKGLDHVTLKTNNLETITKFYVDILGFKIADWRPNFAFNGSWLCLGDKALVHIILTEQLITKGGTVDHIAFTGDSLEFTRDRLLKDNVHFIQKNTPDGKFTQIFLNDPDNNKIEVTFPSVLH